MLNAARYQIISKNSFQILQQVGHRQQFAAPGKEGKGGREERRQREGEGRQTETERERERERERGREGEGGREGERESFRKGSSRSAIASICGSSNIANDSES